MLPLLHSIKLASEQVKLIQHRKLVLLMRIKKLACSDVYATFFFKTRFVHYIHHKVKPYGVLWEPH